MIEVTDATFDQLTGGSILPVLVEFWAPWCGPCKQLRPLLEAAACELGGRVLVLTANTDETTLHRRFGIRAVPALVFLRGHVPLHQAFWADISRSGPLTTRSLLKYIEREFGLESETREGYGVFADLVRMTRTHRRFKEDQPVSHETLLELVDLARLSACGNNRQPLKYCLSWEPERNALIFPQLVWARQLKDWSGPAPGERPAAYIIVLGDHEVSESFGCDHGIASQSIMLGATEKGLRGCMIASVNRKALQQALNIPERYEILLVLALGVPGETVAIERMPESGNTAYWRDAQGVHHVPKRSLEDIIVG